MDLEARVNELADATVADISHRYKMQEELGAGAQATVYKAVHKKSGGKVAVKVQSFCMTRRKLCAMQRTDSCNAHAGAGRERA